MAVYFAVDIENDLQAFVDKVDRKCADGDWSVISSNAYSSDGSTHYYALLERVDRNDYKGKLLSKVDSIESDISSIETNTR